MSQHGEQLGGGPIVHAQTVPPRESCDELSERLYKVSVWTFNKQHDFNCESKCPHDLLRNQVCKEANGYHSKYAAYQNNSWMPAGLTSFYGTSSDEVLRELYDQKRRVTRSLACSNNAYKTKTECVQLSQSVLPHIQPGAYQGAICNQSIIPNKQDSMTGSKLFSFLPYEVGTHASAIRNNSCGHIPFGFEANIHNIVDQMCSENVWKPTGAEAKSLAHNMQPKHGGLASFENYNRNLALSTTLCFEQKISDSDSLIKRQRTSSISTIQAGNSMRFKSKGMNDHPELQARGPRNLERNDLNADTAENWRSSSLKNKEVKMCFQRPCTGPENPVTKYRNPQEAGISKYSAACDYERRRLLALVEYYKFSMNNGFGLIPIINTFTAKHKYVSGNKKRDFCPPIPDSCENTVLYEVEFVKTERWALFQGVDVLAETGESLHHCLDQQIILEMDGGIDLATLRVSLLVRSSSWFLIKARQQRAHMP